MSGSDKSVCIEFVGGYWDGMRLSASRNAKELFHEKTVLVNEPIELCGVWTEIETKKSLLVRYEWRGRTLWEDEVGLVKLFEMDRFMVLDTEGGVAADGLEVDGLGSVETELELDDFNGCEDGQSGEQC